MISLYSKLIGALVFCVIFVSAQETLATEKTSLTPNDYVTHEISNLRAANTIRKYGSMMAATNASLHANRKVPYDQSSRTLTGLDRFIVTVAGTGFDGYSVDDGIAATTAQIGQAYGITVDGKGDIYFVSQNNHRVRKVTVSTGIITTIAGTGSIGFNGDGILAKSAQLNYPYGIALDAPGNVYITDTASHRIRKVTVSTGIITTIAGTGSSGYNGDGIVATSAQLNFPYDVALDGSGNVYFTDYANHRVRKVTVSTGIMTTIAGTGSSGYNGDGIVATSAQLTNPFGIALDGPGNVYFTDYANRRVRKVTVSTGFITTVAGTGSYGYNGDGIMATSASLRAPRGVALDASGNVYFTDTNNHRIRKVTVSTGFITTVAGTVAFGYNGDGIVATSARLYFPYGVALDASGNVHIADTFNYRIRLLTAPPTAAPSVAPTSSPSAAPSVAPTSLPTAAPTPEPSPAPTPAPSAAPTPEPSAAPTPAPSAAPTPAPSAAPTPEPSAAPTPEPSAAPTPAPSAAPTPEPSAAPTPAPSPAPTYFPALAPTYFPSVGPPNPTPEPSSAPTPLPTHCPTKALSPTHCPTKALSPTHCPSVAAPSIKPTHRPTKSPVFKPTRRLTKFQTHRPTNTGLPPSKCDTEPTFEPTTDC